MIVIHHNDADGRASAAIVCWYYHLHPQEGSVSCVEYDYAKPLDMEYFRREIPELPQTVVIVDFSFKPAEMAQIVDAVGHENIVWCDHHATAAAYGYRFQGVRDFSVGGKAGCECTWKHFFPDTEIPEWVTLLGDYDAWRMEFKPHCLWFYEGLKLHDQNPHHGIFRSLLEGNESYESIVEQGKAAISYRNNYCANIRKSYGYETSIGGHRTYAANIYAFGSGGFGEKFGEYPICASYIHDGKRFTVSLYSESVDVGAICKSFGGGGHKGAAGFVCDYLPWLTEPAGCR